MAMFPNCLNLLSKLFLGHIYILTFENKYSELLVKKVGTFGVVLYRNQ